MNFVSADDALTAVRSGQRVYIHNGCSALLDLVQALTRRGPELHNVEVLHMATMGIAPYAAPEFEGHFRHNGLFLASNVRQAVQEGAAPTTPRSSSAKSKAYSLPAPFPSTSAYCSVRRPTDTAT